MLLFLYEIRKQLPAGQTVAEHLAAMPMPVELRVVTIRSREYVAIQDPTRAMLTFPSGPPVYLFDGSDSLVDWTPDIGEGDFHQKWPGVSGGRPITREEASRWPGEGPWRRTNP